MKNKLNLSIVGIALLAAILGCSAPKEQTNADGGNSPANTAIVAGNVTDKAKIPPQAPAKSDAPKDESGVTAANFAKLKTGMKYADVVKILGSEGEMLSENEMAGTKTQMYQWKAGIMSNMNAMFQNGKLISKAQMGLE